MTVKKQVFSRILDRVYFPVQDRTLIGLQFKGVQTDSIEDQVRWRLLDQLWDQTFEEINR
jgi:hypothetical protein